MQNFDSVLGIESQTTKATVDVPGTDVALHYRSDRLPGRKAGRSIRIPLTGSEPPDSLKTVELTVDVAGQHHEFEFEPEPDDVYRFLWDGKDAYGNRVQGSQLADIEIAYVYDGVYQQPDADSGAVRSFGRQSGNRAEVEQRPARDEIVMSTNWEVEIMRFESADLGFGGWMVGPHHQIDFHGGSNRKSLWRGDGSIRSLPGMRAHRVSRVQPNRTASALDNSTRYSLHAIDVAPDGNVVIASSTVVGVGDVVHQVPRSEFEAMLGPGGKTLEKVGQRIAGFSRNSAFRSEIEDNTEAEDTALAYLKDVATDGLGNIYIAEREVNVVRRITPGGTVEFFAGNTTEATGYDGVYDSVSEWVSETDGKVATEVPIVAPNDLAVSPDGNVYLDLGGVLSRVSPDGRIHHIAGSSLDARFSGGSMACGPNGDLFVGAAAGGSILRVDAQNNVTAVAGTGTDDLAESIQSHRPADAPDHNVPVGEAAIGTVADIEVSPAGRVFFADYQAEVDSDGIIDTDTSEVTVRSFQPGGEVVRVAGYGDDSVLASGPLRNAFSNTVGFPRAISLALSPGSELFFAGTGTEEGFSFGRIRMTTDLDTVYFASRDETDLYEFTDGRHTATYDALSGSTRHGFEYDDDGNLVKVTDDSGETIRIERDDDGTLTAFVTPAGERLPVTMTDDGHIHEIDVPGTGTLSFDYGDGGLLQTVTRPSGNTTSFEYDDLGRTIARIRATGGRDELVRTPTDDGYEITHITPEMRETTIETDIGANGKRIATACCGGATRETLITPDGEYKTTLEDGAKRTTTTAPDPRFGDQASYPSSSTYETPSGNSYTTETSRSVSLTDLLDLLSIDSYTETATVNGRQYERTYDPDANRHSVTTPAGRTLDVSLDGSQISTIEPDGVDPVSVTRDDGGRPVSFGRTGSQLNVEFDDADRPSAVTDAEGRRSEMSFDAADNPASFTSPRNNTTEFGYDDDGYLSTVTRPGGDVHDYTFDASGELSSYAPPEGGSFDLTHDGDGLPTEFEPPSGRTVTNVFDSSGHLSEASHPDATVTFDRDDANRITKHTWSPADGGADQTVSTTRDGELVTEMSYSGQASGTFSYAHDADGRVSELTYPDGTTRSISHDDDGLLSGMGPFTIEREGPMGKPSKITDGTLTVDISYDASNNVASRTHVVDGTTIYDVSYTYDASGLLVERTETVAGETRTETFSYDDDGQLTGVDRDGSTVESYDYDADDNRTSRTVDGTTESATYAAGDRLTDQGGTSYSYDDDGYVTDRGGDSLTYSATGDLLEATVDGTTVSYTYDGYGRRVARTEGGQTTEYFYADPNNPTQVTATKDPSGTRTHYLYDPFGRVYAFERGGDWHYVATDQVGTPRVVTAADGTVVRRIDRDAFGGVRSDSAPDFPLHLGFAGGIPDSATGLVRFGQRDYDPTAGRWLGRDPLLLLGDQFNFYAYVDNDPVNGVDPTGMSWECWAEKTGENFGEMLEHTDIIGKLLDQLGVDTGSTDYKSLFKGGIKEFLKQLSKGAGRAAAAKAAAKSMLKSATRGGAYQLALYGGLLVGSGIYAGIKEYFGQGPGEALHELLHGPKGTMKLCKAVKKGLVDHPCPEKLPMECC